MNILTIHNRYLQAGGEDAVFEAESNLLASHGHRVEKLLFDNRSMSTLAGRFLAGFRCIYNTASARTLKEKIQAFAPDVIHVHNFHFIASPSVFFVAHRYHVPVVHTLHNFRLICPSATLYFNNHVYERSIQSPFPLNAIFKGVYRDSVYQTAMVSLITAFHHIAGTWTDKVDKYIVLTNFGLSKFRKSFLHIPEDKFRLKSNFVPDFGVGSEVRDNFFLFVGRLTEEKGITTLLKAAALRQFNLVIVGDGPVRKAVENTVARCTNVQYLGFKSKEEVLHYMKRCRALVFPSLWYEGCPMTILEAFSTGTPVIASNMGSMAEIVKNNYNGLHFEPANEADLVRKIEFMCSNLTTWKQMSQNARHTYQVHYTPEKSYELLMDIYSDLVLSYKL